MPTLAFNRKARFDYTILKTFEAGIVLSGQEVKSVKSGQITLNGSFVNVKNNEAFLTNAYVAPYAKASTSGYNPDRDRKLLLNKKELLEIADRRNAEGLSLVPLSVYTKGGKVKVEIALARGKRKYEKREVIKKRESEKKIRSAIG